MARTRLDEHHFPDKRLSLWAPKFHFHCAGDTWRTTAIVHTAAAELWPIGVDAGAAGELKVDCLTRFRGSQAPLPSLKRKDDRCKSLGWVLSYPSLFQPDSCHTIKTVTYDFASEEGEKDGDAIAGRPKCEDLGFGTRDDQR